MSLATGMIYVKFTTGTAEFAFLRTASTADDPVIDFRDAGSTVGSNDAGFRLADTDG
tara:strand:+ start:63 stop:233 length:171 start_codon:yes stop_codon:yes gene_type:complete